MENCCHYCKTILRKENSFNNNVCIGCVESPPSGLIKNCKSCCNDLHLNQYYSHSNLKYGFLHTCKNCKIIQSTEFKGKSKKELILPNEEEELYNEFIKNNIVEKNKEAIKTAIVYDRYKKFLKMKGKNNKTLYGYFVNDLNKYLGTPKKNYWVGYDFINQ
jgi:hypothetical protein